MRGSTIAGGIALSAAIASLALAAPAHAKPLPLTASGLEQTVLYVHPPAALGTWEQNFYNAEKVRYAPAVCWGSDGKPLTLPKAALGAVGYELAGSAFGTVTVYQYPNAKKAKQAGAALLKISCPDSPMVAPDGGTPFPAEAGSDLSASTVGGSRFLGASVVYQESGQPKVIEQTNTRQVGRVVIQVQVSGPAGPDVSATLQTFEDAANQWIDAVTLGYLRFSG